MGLKELKLINLRLMTLWCKHLGEQCWAILVYGAVETESINSSVCAQ